MMGVMQLSGAAAALETALKGSRALRNSREGSTMTSGAPSAQHREIPHKTYANVQALLVVITVRALGRSRT
jgi:hypothetical protein